MKEFLELVKVMEKLRGPDGCPWDRQQEPEDLKACLIEETYEVIEAIDRKDPGHLQEELGDLLLQVVFLSQIAQEREQFTIREVILKIIDKLTHRHPHVFGGKKLENPDQVLDQWERIKAREKEESDNLLLDGVPNSLPALLKAYRIASKASRVGFDWESASGALAKVEEELEEFRQARDRGANENAREELGDFLFAVANLCRHLGWNPEDALQDANRKFLVRFNRLERKLRQQGKRLSEADSRELDSLWEEVKGEENLAQK